MKKFLFAAAGTIGLIVLLSSCDKLIPGSGAKKTQQPDAAQAAPVKGPVVAKVNGLAIPLSDLDEEIQQYNSLVPADKPDQKITTKEKKLEYLKSEILRRALLYQIGLKKGVDRNPDVMRALDKTKMDLVVLDLVKEETSGIDVTSKEIEDYYNSAKEELREPEERRLREIMVPTETEAKEVLILLLQGGDFATLAKERSKSASAAQGGDLGFVKPGSQPAQVEAVAFSDTLEVGKISNIFQGPGGYYIVKLEAKRGGQLKSLSELWNDIKRLLVFVKQRQKVEEMLSKEASTAKIEIYEGEIK